MRRTFALALFTAASLASAGTALAQDAAPMRPFTLGVSGGLSLPMGDAGDVLKTGFNVGALIAFKPAMLPFGVRVEGQFNQFDLEAFEDDGEELDIDGNGRIISGTANGIFGVPAASSSFRPYLLGGVGVYNQRVKIEALGVSESESQTKFGLNGGVGIEFGLSGLATFIEARYHYIFDKDSDIDDDSNTTYVPISFGIKF